MVNKTMRGRSKLIISTILVACVIAISAVWLTTNAAACQSQTASCQCPSIKLDQPIMPKAIYAGQDSSFSTIAHMSVNLIYCTATITVSRADDKKLGSNDIILKSVAIDGKKYSPLSGPSFDKSRTHETWTVDLGASAQHNIIAGTHTIIVTMLYNIPGSFHPTLTLNGSPKK